jgi:hypothetical protein
MIDQRISNVFVGSPGFGEMIATADEAPRDVDLVVSKPVTVSTLREALAEVVGV